MILSPLDAYAIARAGIGEDWQGLPVSPDVKEWLHGITPQNAHAKLKELDPASLRQIIGMDPKSEPPDYKAAEEPSIGGAVGRDGSAPAVYPGVIPHKPDDDAIATYLAKDPDIAGKLSHFHSNWKMYKSGVWRISDASEVRYYIRTQLRKLREYEVKVNQKRIRDLAGMLEDDLHIPDPKIMEAQERQKNYINLRNGMFNLETMEFEPRHDPDLRFTTQLDFDYDEKARSEVFVNYLESSLVLPNSKEPDYDLINLTLEALAYSMTARTDMKASFWLVGAKDSGKSTFVALLKSLMGSLHATIDLNQLGVNRFLLSGVVGKRIVSFTEADSNSVLPDALFKTLVGGSDEIYADVKNRDPICFRPECKVWWAMNDGQMPRISDRSGATMRRIIIIPFNRSIPEADRISNLEYLLKQERSGIFNLMIDYYKQLQNAGSFTHCQQSTDRVLEYIMDNDTEATYIEERAQVHESYKVQSSDLYADYKRWCEAGGFRAKNMNQVAKEWRRLGFTQKKASGSWWHGLQLKEVSVNVESFSFLAF